MSLRDAITMHAIFHELVSHFVNIIINVNAKTAIAKRLALRLSSHSARYFMSVFQWLFAA